MAPSQWDIEDTIIRERETATGIDHEATMDRTIGVTRVAELVARARGERIPARNRFDDLLTGAREESAEEAPKPPHRERMPSEPPVLEGYQAMRRLGRGGSSDVYLYRQRAPERPVAVKVLHSGLSPQLIQREATLMAAVEHPSIATVHSVGTASDGRGYLVMEFIGAPMAQRLRNEALSLPTVLRCALEIGAALEALHDRGILHGDVKPPNILVRPDGRSVLADFGNAADLHDDASAETEYWGVSVPWAPPEMLSDAPCRSFASEQYSFTATLFSLLFGRAPFEVAGEKDTVAMVHRIHAGRLEIPDRPLPDGLRELLREGLATAPAARPELKDVLVRLGEISDRLPADAAIVDEDRDVPSLGLLHQLAVRHAHAELLRVGEPAIAAYQEAGRHDEAAVARWLVARSLMDEDDWERALGHLDVLSGNTALPAVSVPGEVELALGIARARVGWR
ncbi:MAG: serine/threonine-protein kinase, partial [Microbacterium sp.]